MPTGVGTGLGAGDRDSYMTRYGWRASGMATKNEAGFGYTWFYCSELILGSIRWLPIVLSTEAEKNIMLNFSQ